MDHVWLIGMMGVGKTTVGSLAADTLALPFVDLDDRIVERYGRTISELFADSEEAFRSHERRMVAEVAAGPTSVVATGGGVVLDDANVDTMRNTGTVVLLEASTSVLETRVSTGDQAPRPLLDRADPIEGEGHEAAIAAIEAARSERYQSAAHLALPTDGRDPAEVAREVVQCVST